MWARRTEEYIGSLRERHNLNNKKGKPLIKTGDVVLIQSDEQNRGKLKRRDRSQAYQGQRRCCQGSKTEGREIVP